MDTYSEIVLELAGWVANRSGAILMLSATLPLLLLLKEGRSLSCGALAVFTAAIALILFGIESLAGAVVVIVANSLLVSFALLSTRKRLTQIEDRLTAVVSAVGDLEVAEERRQTFSAKQQAPDLRSESTAPTSARTAERALAFKKALRNAAFK